jgi:hypothetical protein
MWCVPTLDQEYLEVLEVLSQPLHEHAPVVALDERPVQLLDSVRPDMRMKPGRAGPPAATMNMPRVGPPTVFCIVEPKADRHLTHATPNRTAPQFAAALRKSPAAIQRPLPFI